MLAELREQLVDEAANYEKKSTASERIHQRKAAMAYKSATPYATPRGARVAAAKEALLVGIGGPVAQMQYVLMQDNTIGRSSTADIPVEHSSLSRIHTRVLFVDGKFVLQDMLDERHGGERPARELARARGRRHRQARHGRVPLRHETAVAAR